MAEVVARRWAMIEVVVVEELEGPDSIPVKTAGVAAEGEGAAEWTKYEC